jgi:hypothetical protein
MGLYYRGVILSKHTNKAKKIIVKQSFCCYAHDNGAKLMEHSYVRNWYVKEYEHALATEFYGYPLVWSGDYADSHFDTDVYSKALEFVDKATRKNAKALGYRKNKNGRWGDEFIRDGITASEKSLAIATPYEELPTYEYIINLTKKIFVRIPKKTDDDGLIIHPLPLLCADGNNRGGGDYEGTNMKLIGSWAFDRIGVANELPKHIKKELVVEFKECYDGGDSNVTDYKIVKHK